MTVRRRLIRAAALTALAAVLVLGAPLAIVEGARVRADAAGRLEREADASASIVDDRIEHSERVTPTSLAATVRPGHQVRVLLDGRTIVAGDGVRGASIRERAGIASAAVVTAIAPAAEVDRRVHRAWLLIGLLGAGGVIVAVALAVVQARRLSRPLERLAAASARLGDGDFSARAPRAAVPEIDAIAGALDSSAGRIADLVGREREFSANVSHQLRTPLTALRLRLEGAAHAADADGLREDLDAALREADRLEAMIAEVLAHARSTSRGDRARVDVGVVAREHAAVWAPLYARDGRRIEISTAGVAALASRGTVGQVLDVLFDNALRHGAGTVHLSVAADGRFTVLSVADEGAGIPHGAGDRIFDRGTSGRRDGTGIGLPLARTLARAEGGSLRLARATPPCFELRLERAGTADRVAAPSR